MVSCEVRAQAEQTVEHKHILIRRIMFSVRYGLQLKKDAIRDTFMGEHLNI
jgi:hypothetical protein